MMPDVNLQSPFDAYDGENPYVFVSYAHKDAQMVYPEIKALHDCGVRIWFDGGIDPGNEWPEDIARALLKAHAFLVFITPASVESQNVRNEINYAINKKKSFLAVHLQETQLPAGLELRMGDIQAILKYRMTEENYNKKLLSSLSRVLIEEKRPTEIETELIPETFVNYTKAINPSSIFEINSVGPDFFEPISEEEFGDQEVEVFSEEEFGDQDSIDDLTKAIHLDPRNSDAYFKRGLAYLEFKNFQGAIYDFTMAIDLDPVNALAYNNWGIAYHSLQNFLEAINDYTKAIDLDPTNDLYFNNRELAYQALGE